MSLTALAAGLTINVNDKASAKLKTIGAGFQALKQKGAQLRQGLSMAGAALKQFAVGGTAVAGVLGIMAKKAADFEAQMSVVKSVTDPAAASGPQFAALEKEVKRLGATTVYSATEAAKGAEYLTRAGFDTNEVIAALGGTLNAAAADGMDLGSAANIVANTVRGFGMEASKATEVADVLAVTSASTNTNISQLGEAMKYVAPIAAQLGVNVQDSSLALGLLANAGLQGSIGGTALKNMLVKIADMTPDVAKKFNELGIQVQDAKGNMLPFRQIIANLAQALPKMGGNLEQVKLFTEAFGLRGQVAAANLSVAFKRMGEQVDENGVNKFDALVKRIQGAEGEAQRMADTRLKNLTGALKLLGSAFEGLAIEAFTSSLTPAADIVRGMADRLQVVVLAMQGFNDEAESPALTELKEKLGPVAEDLAAFGEGLKEGIQLFEQMKMAALSVGNDLGASFGTDSATMRGLGKFVAIAVPVTAALSIIAVAAGIVAAPFILLGSAALIVVGALGLLAVAGVAALGLLAAGIYATRKEGQTFSERMREVFSGPIEFAKGFAMGVKNTFFVVQNAWGNLKAATAELVTAFQPIADELAPIYDMIAGGSNETGETFTLFVARLIQGAANVIKWLTPLVKWFANDFVAPILRFIVVLVEGFRGMFTDTMSFADATKKILIGFADFLLAGVLKPFKMVALGVLSVLEATGRVETGTAAKIRRGLSDVGSFFGEGRVSRRGVHAARLAKGTQAATLTGAVAGTKRTEAAGLLTAARAKAAPMIAELGPEAAGMMLAHMDFMAEDSKKPIDITNQMCVDGKNMAAATGRVRVERRERTGGVTVPYQLEAVLKHGALPQGSLS